MEVKICRGSRSLVSTHLLDRCGSIRECRAGVGGGNVRDDDLGRELRSVCREGRGVQVVCSSEEVLELRLVHLGYTGV